MNKNIESEARVDRVVLMNCKPVCSAERSLVPALGHSSRKHLVSIRTFSSDFVTQPTGKTNTRVVFTPVVGLIFYYNILSYSMS